MTPSSLSKLNWKTFLRDFLRVATALLGIPLLAGVMLLMLSLLTGSVHLGCPKHDTAELDLRNLQSALKRFHARNQRFPSTQEGIRALVDGGILEQLPLDPWGSPYGYELREGRPRVWSHGADGVPGGEDVDADISNHAPP